MAFLERAEKERVQLTSIDGFFAGQRAPTFIKLDIEVADQHALAGARETIQTSAPKLQICLYHSLNDFVEIPLMIRKYNPRYKLFVGHHTPFFNECVLYAGA